MTAYGTQVLLDDTTLATFAEVDYPDRPWSVWIDVDGELVRVHRSRLQVIA